MTTVEANMADSRHEIVSTIWPIFSQAIGGTIHPIEGGGHPLLQLMDMSAGADYVHVDYRGTLVVMSTRVEWPEHDRSYNNHTVRYYRPNQQHDVEYGKLRRLLNQRHALVPHLMLHAYMKGGRRSGQFVAGCVALTRDVIGYMADQLETYGENWKGLKTNKEDGVVFGRVPWSALEQADRPLVRAKAREADMFTGPNEPWHVNGGAAAFWR